MAKMTASARGTKRNLRDAGKKEHGHEDDADAERGDERGNGDLLRAVENGLHGFLAHGQVAIDVFDFDGGIVHEDADGEGQAAEGHDVDGLAEGAEQQDGDQDREWDRDGDDQGAAPVAQEKQDHQRGEARGDQAFADDALHRGANENGLVEERWLCADFGGSEEANLRELCLTPDTMSSVEALPVL